MKEAMLYEKLSDNADKQHPKANANNRVSMRMGFIGIPP